MEKNKANSIFHLTEEIHQSVTDVYESLMNENDKEAVDNIEEAIRKLKELKDNITKKED